MQKHGGMTEGVKRYKLLCGMHSGEFRNRYEFASHPHETYTSLPTPSDPPSEAT